MRRGKTLRDYQRGERSKEKNIEKLQSHIVIHLYTGNAGNVYPLRNKCVRFGSVQNLPCRWAPVVWCTRHEIMRPEVMTKPENMWNKSEKQPPWAAHLELFNYQPPKYKDNWFVCVSKALAEVLSPRNSKSLTRCVSVAAAINFKACFLFCCFQKQTRSGGDFCCANQWEAVWVPSLLIHNKTVIVIFRTRRHLTKLQMLVIYNR